MATEHLRFELRSSNSELGSSLGHGLCISISLDDPCFPKSQDILAKRMPYARYEPVKD